MEKLLSKLETKRKLRAQNIYLYLYKYIPETEKLLNQKKQTLRNNSTVIPIKWI